MTKAVKLVATEKQEKMKKTKSRRVPPMAGVNLIKAIELRNGASAVLIVRTCEKHLQFLNETELLAIVAKHEF